MRAQDSFIPVQYRLEKLRRDQIRTGALKPGERFPAEREGRGRGVPW